MNTSETLEIKQIITESTLEIKKIERDLEKEYSELTEFECDICKCIHPINHFTKGQVIYKLSKGIYKAPCKEAKRKIDIKRFKTGGVGLTKEIKINITLDKEQMDISDTVLKSLGIVYFVSDNYKVKIGITENVFSFIGSRWNGIQGNSPNRLYILGVIQTIDYKRLEKELHQQFDHLHSHGEWYFLTDEIRNYISENCFNLVMPNRYFKETYLTTPTILSDDLGY